MTWRAASPAHAIAAIRDALLPLNAHTPLLHTLTPAQVSAVHRVRSALRTHRGALVADPPGTGKSFIALQIAIEAHAAGHHVLLSAPAALAPTWRRILQPAGIPATFLSHTRLSLDDHTVATSPAPDLILVDEAHAFRNHTTRRYHTLARLARFAPVLLLSATPINNSLMDMYFLLRIFLGDHAFDHAGIPSLHTAFSTAATTSDALPPPLRRALDTVVIRRSRKELDDENRAGRPPVGHRQASFPLLHSPSLVRYDLDSASPGFARFAVKCITDLRLAAFTSDRRDTAPAELLRLTLAKRLESGAAALAASLRNLVAFHMAFLDALASGYRLRPRDARPPSDLSLQLTFAPLLASPITNAATRSRLENAARLDLEILNRLLARSRRLADADPKRDALLHLLQGPLHNRRTLVFTEFRQTAADLFRATRHIPGTARLDGAGAFLASGPCSRHHLITRFAPHANHAPAPPPHEAITTLIATDILSEGINLQDADCVISYDLPWNPVRLIQRIGRIDRMGSPHASVDAFIFMPDLWLDDFTSLLDRVARKLRHIRRGLAPSPHAHTTPDIAADRHTAFLHALAAGMAPADAMATATTATTTEPALPAGTGLPLASLFDHPRVRCIVRHPAAPIATPVAILSPAEPQPAAILVITAAAATTTPHFTLVRHDSTRPLSTAAAVDLLRTALDSADDPPPRLAPRLLARLQHAATTARRLHTADTATRGTSSLGRVVRHVLATTAAHGEHHPDLAPLADSIIASLARGLPAGAEHAALDWARNTPTPTDPDSAIQALTRLQSTISTPSMSASTTPRPLAVFLLRPPKKRSGAPRLPRDAPPSKPPEPATVTRESTWSMYSAVLAPTTE